MAPKKLGRLIASQVLNFEATRKLTIPGNVARYFLFISNGTSSFHLLVTLKISCLSEKYILQLLSYITTCRLCSEEMSFLFKRKKFELCRKYTLVDSRYNWTRALGANKGPGADNAHLYIFSLAFALLDLDCSRCGARCNKY